MGALRRFRDNIRRQPYGIQRKTFWLNQYLSRAGSNTGCHSTGAASRDAVASQPANQLTNQLTWIHGPQGGSPSHCFRDSPSIHSSPTGIFSRNNIDSAFSCPFIDRAYYSDEKARPVSGMLARAVETPATGNCSAGSVETGTEGGDSCLARQTQEGQRALVQG